MARGRGRGGRERVKVSIPKDIAGFLEREFGSVGEGLRQVVALAKGMAIPPPKHLEKAVKKLSSRPPMSFEELCKEIEELGYRDCRKTVGELFREGFASRDGEFYRVYRYRIPGEMQLIEFLSGLRYRSYRSSRHQERGEQEPPPT